MIVNAQSIYEQQVPNGISKKPLKDIVGDKPLLIETTYVVATRAGMHSVISQTKKGNCQYVIPRGVSVLVDDRDALLLHPRAHAHVPDIVEREQVTIDQVKNIFKKA